MKDVILISISKHEFKQMLNECVVEALTLIPFKESVPESEKLLSVKEASEFLNLAPQTIYGFTSKNLIPFKKKGKKLYFSKSDLTRWLNEGHQKTLSEINKVAENYNRS